MSLLGLQITVFEERGRSLEWGLRRGDINAFHEAIIRSYPLISRLIVIFSTLVYYPHGIEIQDMSFREQDMSFRESLTHAKVISEICLTLEIAFQFTSDWPCTGATSADHAVRLHATGRIKATNMPVWRRRALGELYLRMHLLRTFMKAYKTRRVHRGPPKRFVYYNSLSGYTEHPQLILT